MCESTTHTFQGGANKEHRPLIQASSSDSSGKNCLFSQTVEQTQQIMWSVRIFTTIHTTGWRKRGLKCLHQDEIEGG